MLIPHRQPIAMEVIFMERACGGDLHDVQPFDPDTEMSEETGIQLLNGETTVSKSCNGETNQPINGHHLPNSGPSFDFIKNVSAAELLKTIATATSQANQLITAHNSGMKNHPLPLGLDLNSMINDAKSSSLKSPTLSQHNFKDQDGGVLSFNGLSQGLSMNNGLSHGLTVNVNSGNEPVIISDGDRRQSDSAFSPNLLPFDGQIPTGQMPQIPHNGVSSPEYPTSSTGSPYTDPNLSPFDSGVNFMETEHGVPLPLNPSNGLSFPADTATQSSLINGTDRLCIDSIQPIDNVDSELKPKQELTDLDFENKAGKVPRMPQDSDASTASTSMLPSVDCVFNPDEAQQEVPNEFIFTKFGQEGDDPNLGSVYPFRSEGSEVLNSESPALPSVVSPSPFKTPTNVFKKRGELRRQKEPILCQHFPASKHGCELRILEQPEDQHRARYLTEGSRGAVKSKNGNGHPVVKLFGYSGEATLQVFIGNDNGKVRPHGFYQACKVCGKNSTQCVDRDIDGTTVIEITLCPSNDMTATIDCVGILKLRNADVEQRIGLSKAKKKSTKARMIFRVTFQKPCGSPQVLQLPSHTILCTQPIGQPEICKMSLKESFMSGGDELFIIGKNFLRGTRVFFQQMVDDQDDPLWEREGEIDKDFFQTTHLIVVVPSYDGDTSTLAKANFQVVVHSGGKISESQPFAYKSDDPDIKQDMDMTVEDNGRKRNYPFVAPEALELNHQIQRSSSGSDSMFKLPPSVISEVMDQTTSYSAMDQSPSNQPEASNQSIVQSKSDGSFHSSDSSRRESFSMNQISDDTLSEVQSHFNEGEGEVQWEVKNEDLFEKADSDCLTLSSLDFNSNSDVFSSNSDVFSSQPMDVSYNDRNDVQTHTSDSFMSGVLGVQKLPESIPQSAGSIVSQFLQNIEMALQNSVMSSRAQHNNDTIMTSASSHSVMTTDKLDCHNVPKGSSFLKEALTCSTANLDAMYLPTLQATAGLKSSQKNDADIMNMDINLGVDSALKALLSEQALNSTQQPVSVAMPSTINTLEDVKPSLGFTVTSTSDTIDLTQSDETNKEDQHIAFTPQQIAPSIQSGLPFQELLLSTSQPMGSQPLTIPGSMYELGGSSHTSLATVHHPPAAFQSLVSSLQNSIMSVQSSSQPAGQGHNLPASGINMPTSLAQLPQFLQLIASHGLSQSQQDKIQQQLQNNAGQQQPSGHVNLNQELIQSVLQQHLSQKTNLQNGRIQTSQQQQQQQQQHLLVTSPPQQHGMSPSPSQQYQQPMDNICAPQHQQNQPSQQQFVSPSQDAQVHSSQPHTPLQFPPPSPTMAPASPYTSVASPHTPQVSSMVHLGSPMVNHTDLAESPSPAMVQSPMPASPYLPSQQPTGAQPPAVQVDQSMAQPQLFLQGMTQSQTLSTVTGALNMQAAGFPGTTVAASSAQSTPTAPQIIICNSSPQGMPGTQGQFGGGAPSIVIVPGQGGSNNNMESLLRSILGSMMPQQQTQPAEPPTQTPMNE
ncbi:nuclear factor of activated T-cells 5-like isoform X2 [Mya arenaria]|uniref:nuclear factor of activated T-cells 5-like isoform X2 n=1 Tax=Mya arenaria TaxID=6604 RepID=UPI0022E4B706|nr:nuclear factor of activated T-cells 5-like isoform X2 [Mya arenaria]